MRLRLALLTIALVLPVPAAASASLADEQTQGQTLMGQLQAGTTTCSGGLAGSAGTMGGSGMVGGYAANGGIGAMMSSADGNVRGRIPPRAEASVAGREAGERHVLGQLPNFLMASSVTGVKRLTRLPSGSRNRMERLPQGIVVGS